MTKTKAQQIMAATEVRAADDVTAAIQDIAAEFEPYIIKQRRHFHKHPELSLAEERTTSDIANQLDAMNIPYERPLKTGLVATLRGTAPDAYREDGTPRRRILLRADIDALPVTEQTGEDFASVNEGCMHACGHDCHIAMMLGTLQILRHMTDDIHGEVRIVFQPSEENGQGAKLMIGTGVLDGVDGAYAAHIWSEVDAGTVSCEPGPRMANTDWFRIDVRGTSCHGAMPQRGHDAVMVAAEIVNALQTIVSREISPYEPAVITGGALPGAWSRKGRADLRVGPRRPPMRAALRRCRKGRMTGGDWREPVRTHVSLGTSMPKITGILKIYPPQRSAGGVWETRSKAEGFPHGTFQGAERSRGCGKPPNEMVWDGASSPGFSMAASRPLGWGRTCPLASVPDMPVRKVSIRRWMARMAEKEPIRVRMGSGISGLSLKVVNRWYGRRSACARGATPCGLAGFAPTF